MDVDIRPVPAAASYPLRHAVLRPHQSLEEMLWEGDDDSQTATFAALERESGAVVGVATVYPSPAPFEQGEAAQPTDPGEGRTWRLRGMATREDLRGQGIGSRVLDALLTHVKDLGGEIVWCNARVRAIPFYKRAGFETWGEEWELPSIGRHVVMWRKLTDEQPDD